MTIAATEPFTAANLQSEINNGPFKTTFAPLVTSQDFVDIAKTLNDETNATGQGPVLAPPISGAALLAAIHAPDLNNLSALQLQELQVYTSAASVNASDPAFQQFITSLFTQEQSTTTYNTLTGLGYAFKIGSRAEVLFGTGVTVTNNDVQFAVTGSGPSPHVS